jgi:hypothetical protein
VDIAYGIDVKVRVDQMDVLDEMEKCQELGAGLGGQLRHMLHEFGVEGEKNPFFFSFTARLIVVVIAHGHFHFSG